MSSQVRLLDFAALEKMLDAGIKTPLDVLAKKRGVVHVIMVTRDRCPSCKEQKPLFEKLAVRVKKKYTEQIEFIRVHSSYSQERTEEATKCLEVFNTIGFPTYIMAIRDNTGKTLEIYRSLDAPTKEIERNVSMGIAVVELIRERNKTHAG